MENNRNLNTAGNLLRIYKIRLGMQSDGITNPPDDIKKLTKELVEQLSRLPPEVEFPRFCGHRDMLFKQQVDCSV